MSASCVTTHILNSALKDMYLTSFVKSNYILVFCFEFYAGINATALIPEPSVLDTNPAQSVMMDEQKFTGFDTNSVTSIDQSTRPPQFVYV